MIIPRVLEIQDLISEPIIIKGIRLDAEINIVLQREGANGPIEINSTDIKQVYVTCDEAELRIELKPKYASTGNTKIDQLFWDEVLRIALAKAALAPEYLWERKGGDA